MTRLTTRRSALRTTSNLRSSSSSSKKVPIFTSKKRASLERVAIGGETLLFSICEIRAGEKPVSRATSCRVNLRALRSFLILEPMLYSIPYPLKNKKCFYYPQGYNGNGRKCQSKYF